MANELTTNDQADLSKAVAAFANNTAWTLVEAVKRAQGIDLASVIAGYEKGLQPLAEAEPGGMSARDSRRPGAFTTGLGDDLALLATKIAPTIATEQADAWIKVMVLALSDLPGRVAREAAQVVLRMPLRFMNEIEGAVRTEAGRIDARHRTALLRLQRMQSEIARAAKPLAALPPPDPLVDPAELTVIMQRLANAKPVTADLPRDLPRPAQAESTIEDYLALGLSEADARAALAERERLLRRQPKAQSIGSVAIAAE